ncbi:hypothetical protein N7532_010414 [Penicillium argentinense]|uniref:Complex 1 LYR protein domain-containing protein n=1 Tax=Penicillium argentinense TaxID=1131581 RepID=A0A9W9EPJ6_9EURO|nr:uncharacterized protein N7532_010414 [Penicillium argentinense]KAJ5085643.1 hypothetical protein N7532_010414 [Penicillium argentinense]
MARLSGLQREVLSLYRKCLREVRNKPLDSQSNFRNYARYVLYQVQLILSLSRGHPIGATRLIRGDRAEFQKHRSVNKKDFGAVEYLLRKGHRQLEMYASPGIRNIR